MKKATAKIGILVLLIAAVMLSGCGFSGSKNTEDKITISHCQGEWAWSILDEVAEDYKEATGTAVEFIYVPADSYSQWVSAQFMAGNEPDIFWGGLDTSVSTYYNNGKIISLTKYFNAPSKYTGNIWKDDFITGALDNCFDDTGKEYIMSPLSTSPFNLYYNKKVFNELNLTPPSNWSELFDVMKTIKDSDKDLIPFSIQNSMPCNLEWFINPVIEDMYANSDILSKLDIINPNGVLDKVEAMLGIKTGVIKFTDEAFFTYFKLMKDMVPYFNADYNSIGWEYEALFNDEKSAMTNNGGWYPNQHLLQNYKVDYGVMPLPYVDKAISPNSRGVPVKYSTAVGGSFTISKMAENEGRAEKAIDFIQYMTSPNGGGKTWVDKSLFLPVIKNVDVPEALKPLVDCTGDTTLKYNGNDILSMDKETYSKYNEMFRTFLETNQSTEDFAKEVQELYVSNIDRIINSSTTNVMDYVGKVK